MAVNAKGCKGMSVRRVAALALVLGLSGLSGAVLAETAARETPGQHRAHKAEPARHAKRHHTAAPIALSSDVKAPDNRASQRAVCQSQCNLERMACDQGRGAAFQNRTDQIRAQAMSCGTAVQGCLSRC